MNHINYYQLYQTELSQTVDDATRHANNQVLYGIITIIGMEEFNDWIARHYEQVAGMNKLSMAERARMFSSTLHQSLVSRSQFSHDDELTITGEGGSTTTPMFVVLEDMLYQAMIGQNDFWIIVEKIFTYYENNG